MFPKVSLGLQRSRGAKHAAPCKTRHRFPKRKYATRSIPKISISEFFQMHRPTWAEIDLDAVEHNIREFKSKAFHDERDLVAVVKADAYGHGAIEVAESALRAGATRLAVATVEEGIQLRSSGRIPDSIAIHCMGLFMSHQAATFVRYNITPTVHSVGAVQAIEQAAATGASKRFPIHLKIDTGMGRIGALPKSVESIAKAIEESKTLSLEGVFTHFSKADERDKSYTKRQVEAFEKCLSTIKKHHLKPQFIHAANSAGSMDHHDIGDPSDSIKSNMFRVGISMYGYYPSDEMSNKNGLNLKPVMTWKTRIIQSKNLAPGHRISYGGYYETSRHPHTSIATLPVGYADGYRRLLGTAKNHKTGKVENHGWGVLLRGHKANIVGRVCMDMFMIDVTDIADHHGGEVREGEEIVLMGQQGHSQITCDDMATALGTITYEVTCLVGKRVPRVYLRGGQPVLAKSLLGEFNLIY